MSGSLNSVNLVGNLTKDPISRTTNNGNSVCKLTVAVNNGFGDNKETAFVDIDTWGKTADFCSQYLVKGRSVIVKGRLRNDNWTDKEGNNHYGMVVVADRLEVNDSKKEESRETETVGVGEEPF